MASPHAASLPRKTICMAAKGSHRIARGWTGNKLKHFSLDDVMLLVAAMASSEPNKRKVLHLGKMWLGAIIFCCVLRCVYLVLFRSKPQRAINKLFSQVKKKIFGFHMNFDDGLFKLFPHTVIYCWRQRVLRRYVFNASINGSLEKFVHRKE